MLSVHVFEARADCTEETLTLLRAVLQSNANLYDRMLEAGLERYLRLTSLRSELTIPGIKRTLRLDSKGKPLPPEPVMISTKVIADSAEALLAAVYLSGGLPAAHRFLRYLKIIPEDAVLSYVPRGPQAPGSAPDLDPDGACPMLTAEEALAAQRTAEAEVAIDMEALAASIGYRFQSKALAAAALTNGAYQRLEFLGDAVLDMLIVTGYAGPTPLNFRRAEAPQLLTFAKHHLLNSEQLGIVAVSRNLHRHLTGLVPTLQSDIDAFVELLSREDGVINTGMHGNFYGGREGGATPKILADIVESVVGAIYLDLRGDLQALWGIVKSWFAELHGGDMPSRELLLSTEGRNPKSALKEKIPSARFLNQLDIESRLWTCRVVAVASGPHPLPPHLAPVPVPARELEGFDVIDESPSPVVPLALVPLETEAAGSGGEAEGRANLNSKPRAEPLWVELAVSQGRSRQEAERKTAGIILIEMRKRAEEEAAVKARQAQETEWEMTPEGDD